MTVANVQASQASRSTVQLSWVDDADSSIWRVSRSVDGGAYETVIDIFEETTRSVTDGGVETVGIGQTVAYRILNYSSGLTADSQVLTVSDPDADFTNAPPMPAASAPRYTDVATVKRRMKIPADNTDFDEDIEESIVAAEIALDYECGQSFPSNGDNPQYGAVPYSVVVLATAAAIGTYKALDAPFGVAGGDDGFGALSVADVASQTIRRSPLLKGLQLSFGVG